MCVAEITTLYGGQSSSWLLVSRWECCKERNVFLYLARLRTQGYFVFLNNANTGCGFGVWVFVGFGLIFSVWCQLVGFIGDDDGGGVVLQFEEDHKHFYKLKNNSCFFDVILSLM